LYIIALLAIVATLTWQDNSKDEDGFIIERRPFAGGPFVPIATVIRDTTTLTDMGIQEGFHYCYRVAAFNKAGQSTYTNEACTIKDINGNLIVIIK
jgi:hypothetical protein